MMRRRVVIPVLVTTLLWSSALDAQSVSADKLPTVVRAGYASRFPGTRKVEWKRKSDRSYEAEFDLHGIGIAAKFDSTGTWLETESDITAQQIPAAVNHAVGRSFKGYAIIERQRLERRSGPTLFELHLANTTEILKTQFDSAGAVLMRQSKPRR